MAPSSFTQNDSDYVQRSSVVTKAAEQVRNSLEELARNDGNLTVIDTKSSFCDADKCKLWNADHLAYEDNNHVSRYGAQLVLNSQFEKAMAR